ncbi:MAG: hypothetical protein V3U31_02215 [Dehalococcoidia bacterium]
MRRPILVLLVLIPFLVLVVAVGWRLSPLLSYGSYQSQVLPPPRFGDITVPLATPQPFTDSFDMRKGILLVDRAHDNRFALDELSPLAQRLLSRAYTLDYWQEEDSLAAKLRRADALAVVLPHEPFTDSQRQRVRDFVAQGGKLLLMGDPTRPGEISSLAAEFGLVFHPDYLYNLRENDGNFRYIFVRDFEEHQLTRGLEQINLYTAGSITGGRGLATTDAYTYSDTRGAQGYFTPVALAAGEQVLALGDFTFLTVPHSSLADNDLFLSRIADWLTVSQRRFSLAQFPYFFPGDVRVEMVDAEAVAEAIRLRNLLEGAGREAEVTDFQTETGGDRLVLGLFKDAEEVGDLLDRAGIEVTVKEEEEAEEPTPNGEPEAAAEEEPPVRRPPPLEEDEEEEPEFLLRIEGVGEVPGEGTALLWLDPRPQGRLLLVLADSEEGLRAAVAVLEAGEVGDWLVRPDLAVYRSGG